MIKVDELIPVIRATESFEEARFAVSEQFLTTPEETDAILATRLNVLADKFYPEFDPKTLLEYYRNSLEFKNKQRWERLMPNVEYAKDSNVREAHLLAALEMNSILGC